MSDTARQPAQQPELSDDERKQRPQGHPPQERQSALPAPSEFYEEFGAREDVRAILTRLAYDF